MRMRCLWSAFEVPLKCVWGAFEVRLRWILGAFEVRLRCSLEFLGTFQYFLSFRLQSKSGWSWGCTTSTNWIIPAHFWLVKNKLSDWTCFCDTVTSTLKRDYIRKRATRTLKKVHFSHTSPAAVFVSSYSTFSSLYCELKRRTALKSRKNFDFYDSFLWWTNFFAR